MTNLTSSSVVLVDEIAQLDISPRLIRLSRRQHSFVEEYLSNGFNASAAALTCGYGSTARSAKVRGHELVTNRNVREAIAARCATTSAAARITSDRVLAQITAIAFSSIGDVMSWGPNGVTIKDSSELTAAQIASISEIASTTLPNGKVRVRVKFHNKLAALDSLVKILLLDDPSRKDGDQSADIVAYLKGVDGFDPRSERRLSDIANGRGP